MILIDARKVHDLMVKIWFAGRGFWVIQDRFVSAKQRCRCKTIHFSSYLLKQTLCVCVTVICYFLFLLELRL